MMATVGNRKSDRDTSKVLSFDCILVKRSTATELRAMYLDSPFLLSLRWACRSGRLTSSHESERSSDRRTPMARRRKMTCA